MSNGEVFADIAAKYDRLNRVLSLGRDQAWRRSAIGRLPDGRLLDLGAGTGAADPAFGERTVVALDPSSEMLSLNRLEQRVVGVGERLPFVDGAFDAVFSAYVFRNLNSVAATLEEIHRVLRPGGKAGIVDLSRPIGTMATRVHRVGTRTIVPLVGRLARAPAEYRYLSDSLDKLPPPEVMFAQGPLRLEESWRMGPLGFVYGVILAKA
jgi:demethylmenaquinone methyltransferase/2-methoxy-6-polyprenyl-1,4-benzoquinol methylase